MPEAPITTTNRGYILVRKALNASETWDWFGEYINLWTQVDQDIQDLEDLINFGGTLKSLTFDTTTGPTLTPEGTLWWNQDEYTVNIATGIGATIQVGQETLLLMYNATGSLIPNGTVIRPAGTITVSGHLYPTAGLAQADRHENCVGTLCVATHDAANGSLVLATRFGRVRDLDTTSYTPAVPLWLSPTVAGGLTNTKPEFPYYSIQIGGAADSHATEGTVLVSITTSVTDIFHANTDGGFAETVDFIVTSDGANITGSLDCNYDSGRDLTMIFSDGLSTLDTTPAATVTLVAGTDDNPQQNYVYVPKSTKVLTVSTSEWPTTEHIRVACVCCQSAATTQADGGPLKNQNWNDHLKKEGENGHMLHIAYAMREKLGATWKSGCELTGSVVTQPAAPDDVYVATTGGVVMQLHDQVVQAFDLLTGDDVSVYNDSVTPFTRTSNLNTLLTDAQGVTMSGNAFSLVIWGVANKTGQPDRLFCNLPNSSYVIGPADYAIEDAINDINGYAVYDMPQGMKSVGFLIARLTYRHTTTASGTWVLHDTEDLRGKIANISAGGAAGGTGVTTFLGLTDTNSTYASFAGRVPMVNAGETGLEFAPFTDSAEIDFTATTSGITAALVAGSIAEGKLNASVNASLDLADSAIQATTPSYVDLTDGGDSSAHYHSADRARANHTGTQTASTISDFQTTVSANTDVAANTAARHAELHAASHEYAGADVVNAGNLDGSATVANHGLVIEDGSINGSADEAAVRFSDHRNLRTITSADTNIYSAVSDSYLVINKNSPNELVLYDKARLVELKRFTATSAFGPIRFIDDSTLVQMSTSTLYYYNIPDFTIIQSAAITTTALCDVDVGKLSGQVYLATGTDVIQRRNLDGTLDDSGPLPGMAYVICSFKVSDDELTLYVVDASTSGAGDVEVRAYDISDISTPGLLGSYILTASVNGELYSRIGWHGGWLVVATTKGGLGRSERITLLDVSDPENMVPAFNSSVTTLYSYGIEFADGVIWAADNAAIKINAIPSLTVETPRFENHYGNDGIWASPGLLKDDGDYVQATNVDIINAAQKAANPALMHGAALNGLPGLKITNAEYGDDTAVLGEYHAYLYDYTAVTNTKTVSWLDASSDYIVQSASDGTLTVYDRRTGETLASTSITGYGPVVIDGNTVIARVTAGHQYFSLPSLSDMGSLSTGSGFTDLYIGRTSGMLYAPSGTSLFRYTAGDYEYDATTGALPSISQIICAVWMSHDENTLYIIDADDNGASTATLRIYSISTFTSPTLTGSLSLTATVNGELYAKIGEFGGYLVVDYTAGGAQTAKRIRLIDISTPASPVEVYAAANTYNGYGVRIADGTVIRGYTNGIYIDRLPSLTTIEPDFVDSRGGAGLYSADDLLGPDGTKVEWTKADTGRAVQLAHNPALMTGAADTGQPGLKIHNGEYGDDTAVLGEFRDIETLRTFTTTSTGWQTVAAGGSYVMLIDGTSYTLLNRRTGEELVDAGTLPFSATAVAMYGDFAVVVGASNLAVINPISLAQVMSVSASFGTVDNIYVAPSGNIYFVNSTDNLYIYDQSGTQLYSGALSGITYDPCSIIVDDDETYFYIVDAERVYSTGPDAVLRKYVTSTKALDSSSSGMTCYSGYYSSMGWHDGNIALNLSYSTSALSNRIRIIRPSDLVVLYESPTSVTAVEAGITDGRYYNLATATVTERMLPSLTTIEPAFIDSRGGDGVYSTDSLRDAAGRTVEWTKSDMGRAVRDANPGVDRTVKTNPLLSRTIAIDENGIVTGARGGILPRDLVSQRNYDLSTPPTSVLDQTATPASTPYPGDAYLVGASATGVWAGHDDDIAKCVATKSDTTSWATYAPEADLSFIDICWSPELRMFCAVANSGTGNRVLTSTDGKTWVSQSSASDNNWQAVCWGNGRFVAVSNSGTGNRVMTSDDGIVWTSRTSASDSGWLGVAWGESSGLYVACGNGGIVMTSPDGETWTGRTTPNTNNLQDICWSDELHLYCCVANSGINDRVITSSDGINWREQYNPADNDFTDVCWGSTPGLFVAVSNSGTGDRVMTSPNGKDWTMGSGITNSGWRSVCYSPELGMYCAVANSTAEDRIMVSTDGKAWMDYAEPVTNGWNAICWSSGLGKFAAVATTGTGNGVMTSGVDTTWLFYRPQTGMRVMTADDLVEYLYDGSSWTAPQRFNIPTVRTVDADSSISLSDRGNIIKVYGHTGTVSLTADSAVLADDTFRVTIIADVSTQTVRVLKIASTSATFNLVGSADWAMTDFGVAEGEMVPMTVPTYVEA